MKKTKFTPETDVKKVEARDTDIFKGKGRIKNYMSGFYRAAIVAMLVLLQLAFIIVLSVWLSGATVYIYAIIEFASLIIIFGLVNDSRRPSYKIAWICTILILPVTGHIMYALWGVKNRKKKLDMAIINCIKRGEGYLTRNDELVESFTRRYPTKSRMVSFLQANNMPLFANNSVKYFQMADIAFESIFEDIKAAKKFVLIDFFIVGEGVLWDRMHEILKKKVTEGVEIKFMFDDFGSMFRIPKNFKESLEAEGIQVAIFNPIHRYTGKLYMNYRSHQKIIVIDGNIAYTGGMNLADEYVNLVERFGIWKDAGIRIEGDAAWGFTVVFFQMWEACHGFRTIDYDKYRPCKKFTKSDIYCQVVSDGPVRNPKHPIEGLYKHIIYCAKNYIFIATPYLLIEDDMRQALIYAAESGVDVRIITPYIPDKKLVKLLTEYNYGQLLKNGVKIYEYKPGFIHSKVIINEECGVVGTVNMDYRSFFLHYECGAFLCDRKAISPIKDDFLTTLGVCRQVTYDEWLHRPLYIKILQNALSFFSTLM
jgi:cardiolipin synthase A/B